MAKPALVMEGGGAVPTTGKDGRCQGSWTGVQMRPGASHFIHWHPHFLGCDVGKAIMRIKSDLNGVGGLFGTHNINVEFMNFQTDYKSRCMTSGL